MTVPEEYCLNLISEDPYSEKQGERLSIDFVYSLECPIESYEDNSNPFQPVGRDREQERGQEDEHGAEDEHGHE